MSGDVQPRKRKDKRRKKDDADESETPPPTLVNPSSDNSTDNLTLHVHKEGAGTGGHWCARIIFFALLSVLVGLVGVIILEQRGNTDVDTPITSSRWAMIFDGWVDDVVPQHEDEQHDDTSSADEASEETAGDTEHDDADDTEEQHSHEEEEEEEEEEEGEGEGDSSEKLEDGTLKVEDEDEGIGSDDEAADEEDEDEDEDEDDDDDDDETFAEEEISSKTVNKDNRAKRDYPSQDRSKRLDEQIIESDEGFEDSSRQDFDTPEEAEDAASEEDDDDLDNDDDDALEEEDDEQEEQIDEEEEEDEEKDGQMEDEYENNERYVSIEGVQRTSRESRLDEDDADESPNAGLDEIDDNSAEPLEEIEDGDLEEVVDELVESELPDETEEEMEEESASVAVKFGVGVALIVAAHFVLVRRWNNVEADLAGIVGDDNERSIDLSRRDTIIPTTLESEDTIDGKTAKPSNIRTSPMKLDDNDDRDDIDDERSMTDESYEESRNRHRGLVQNPAAAIMAKTAKTTSSASVKQARSLDKPEISMPKAGERGAKLKEKDDEEEEMEEGDVESTGSEDQSDPEEEASEEEEEEEDEEDEEDDEEPDDGELVAKLEAKYGKLPTPEDSEEEEEEDEEDEEEEEEEEDEEEDIRGWKRVGGTTSHGGVSSPRSGDLADVAKARESPRVVAANKETQRRTTAAQKGDRSGGNDIGHHSNDSSLDEITIQEEDDSWLLSEEFDN